MIILMSCGTKQAAYPISDSCDVFEKMPELNFDQRTLPPEWRIFLANYDKTYKAKKCDK